MPVHKEQIDPFRIKDPEFWRRFDDWFKKYNDSRPNPNDDYRTALKAGLEAYVSDYKNNDLELDVYNALYGRNGFTNSGLTADTIWKKVRGMYDKGGNTTRDVIDVCCHIAYKKRYYQCYFEGFLQETDPYHFDKLSTGRTDKLSFDEYCKKFGIQNNGNLVKPLAEQSTHTNNDEKPTDSKEIVGINDEHDNRKRQWKIFLRVVLIGIVSILVVIVYRYFQKPEPDNGQRGLDTGNAPIWNTALGDCPTIAIGNFNTGEGTDTLDCWNKTSIEAYNPSIINVLLFYHNVSKHIATNTRILLSISPSFDMSNNYKFTGTISSDKGNTSGTASVNISSIQKLTFVSASWLPDRKTKLRSLNGNYSFAFPNKQSDSLILSKGILIGDVGVGHDGSGKETQGYVIVTFAVGYKDSIEKLKKIHKDSIAPWNGMFFDHKFLSIANITKNYGFDFDKTSVSADFNDIVVLDIYYHNTSLQDATNTKVSLSVSPFNSASKSYTFHATVKSDQGTIVGSATLHLSTPQRIKFNSVFWYPNHQSQPVGFPYSQNDDAAIIHGGVNLGTVKSGPFGNPDGEIQVSFSVLKRLSIAPPYDIYKPLNIDDPLDK